MRAGDRIRVEMCLMGIPNGTRDYTVEEFRYCLGFFKSEDFRKACKFTPLCNLFERGPDSKSEYISNYGQYVTNQVQGWMDLPRQDNETN